MSTLADAIDELTGPNREIDACIALMFNTYQHLADGLSDADYESEVKTITYRQFYDDVEVKVGIKGRETGGLRYSAKLPAYTASYDAAKTLLPDTNWTLVRRNTSVYVLFLHGKVFEHSTEALVICRAVTHLKEIDLL